MLFRSLDDRTQPDHRRTDTNAGEPELGDWRVDDAHLAEFLKQPLGDFVCALIDRDFLAHEENAVVTKHLLAEGLVQGISISDYWHVLVTGCWFLVATKNWGQTPIVVSIPVAFER